MKTFIVATPQEFEHMDYSFKNIHSDSVIRGIEEEIRNVDANLLIMIPQRYGFWESIIHRIKTRIMALGLPFLYYRSHNKSRLNKIDKGNRHSPSAGLQNRFNFPFHV